jgi:nicotinate-nucleotide--dimethylbenzimidazole phosphoribosyltransferase
MSLLDNTLAAIRPADREAAAAAQAREDNLTKPRGSLGLLEEVAVKIAAMRGTARPRLGPGAVFVMAADHGVAAEGVSLYPQEVTAQMVANFLAGGAAINVLSKAAGARVVVTDVGVASDIPPSSALYSRKIAPGTANMARGPAMTRDQARRSIEAGMEVFEAECTKEAFHNAATGDMGIANTTPSAAIAAVLMGQPPRSMVGRGTGVDDAGMDRKVTAIEKAISANRPDSSDALDVLAKVGGFEIGAIAGVCLAAAARRMPVVVDGFISTAGALIAASLAPAAKDYMLAAHASAEGGHRAMLAHLGLKPLLDLGLRLGEGTGSALAIPLCVAACRILDEMATFSEAGVSDKDD